MKTKLRVKKKISKPINSRVKKNQRFFIVSGICLGLFILIWFLNSKYFSKKNINETKTETKSEITPTITQQPIPTKIVDPSGWTTYNSKELGLSFKYPNYWGEPESEEINYNDKNDPEYFRGKAVYINFKNNIIISGRDKDFRTYLDSHSYLGDKKDLDVPETFSQKEGNIYFTKKVTVANQKTAIETSLEYLAEASGISIKSSTKLNGQNEYSGIEITALYRNFNEILDKYYDSMENKGLEPVAIKLLTELKNGTSSDKEMGKLYKDYQTLLSSIKFN